MAVIGNTLAINTGTLKLGGAFALVGVVLLSEGEDGLLRQKGLGRGTEPRPRSHKEEGVAAATQRFRSTVPCIWDLPGRQGRWP